MKFGTTDIINIEEARDIDMKVKASIYKLFDELNDFFSCENIVESTRWKCVYISIDSRLDGKINIVKLCESVEWPKFFNPRTRIISMPFNLGGDPEIGYQIDVIYNDHIEESEING